MKTFRIIFGIIVLSATLIWSCSGKKVQNEVAQDSSAILQSEFDEAKEVAVGKISTEANPVAPKAYISSSAAVENLNDTARKMIRTADIRFKVKDVIKATYNIENITVKHGGFVENTNLASQIDGVKETRIKKDSMLVTTYYTVVNTLILRVPNTKLDTTLKEIAQWVDFMDYRIINAKDVTLDLLSKTLEQSRLARYDSRMKNAIDSKGLRLNDMSNAENNLLEKQEQADAAKLANFKIFDQIKFSTINLSLYQNQNIKYETVAREKDIKSYTEPLGTRILNALKFGWTIIVEICLFLINLWSLILLVGVLFFIIRFLLKKRGVKKQ